MALKLYDLAARDPRVRFSPYCWRSKMALKHKGLEFETIPWRFTDKEAIAPTKQGRVPVLIDGPTWIHDSWQIALYLDRTYPDRPALLPTRSERTAAHFTNFWCDLTLHLAMRPLLLLDVYRAAAEKDQPYFRDSREKAIGSSLEDLCADAASAQKTFLQTMAPAENVLANEYFLGGEQPNYRDYILFGSLQWARAVKLRPILVAESATGRWFERMLDLFDGYGRQSPTVRDMAAA